MPRKQVGKKIDINGNLVDLGNTVSDEDLNNIDQIPNKLEKSNIKAGSNITLDINGNDITINSTSSSSGSSTIKSISVNGEQQPIINENVDISVPSIDGLATEKFVLDNVIKTLESPIRIWDLEDGLYKLLAGCVVYYRGATSETSFTIVNPSVLQISYANSTQLKGFNIFGHQGLTYYGYSSETTGSYGSSGLSNIPNLSPNTGTKAYLIGAGSKTWAGLSYTEDNVYMENGKLYSNGEEVITQNSLDTANANINNLKSRVSTNETNISNLQNGKADKTELDSINSTLDSYNTTIINLNNNKVDKTTKINNKQLSGDITISKSDVGLSNVDNTSDANKPISTATQAALNKKLDASSYVVDNDFDIESTNPIQNRWVTNAFLRTPEYIRPSYDKDTQILSFKLTNKDDTNYSTEVVGLSSLAKASDLNNYVPNTRTINGKSLSGNITLNANDVGALPNTTTIPSIDGLASETFVTTKISELVNSAPTTLDTLGEIATALQENEDVVEALNTSIGNKADKTELNNYFKYGTSNAPKADANDTVAMTNLFSNSGNQVGFTGIIAGDETAPILAMYSSINKASSVILSDSSGNTLQISSDGTIIETSGSTFSSGKIVNSSELAAVATTGSYNSLSNKPTIPTAISQLSQDATHRIVTDTQISTWNAKSNFSGSYNDLTNKPTIPTKTSQLTNDSNFLTSAPVTSVNGKTGVVQLTASDVGALPNTTTIPIVNNGTLTIQKNGTSVGTFTANQSANSNVNITCVDGIRIGTNGLIQRGEVVLGSASEKDATTTFQSGTNYLPTCAAIEQKLGNLSYLKPSQLVAGANINISEKEILNGGKYLEISSTVDTRNFATKDEIPEVPSNIVNTVNGQTGDVTINVPDVSGFISTTANTFNTSSGGIKFSNGLIINWGTLSISSNGAKTINFKYAFSSGVVPIVMRTNRGSGSGSVVVRALSVYNVSNTSFTVYGYTDDTPVTFIAIGY